MSQKCMKMNLKEIKSRKTSNRQIIFTNHKNKINCHLHKEVHKINNRINKNKIIEKQKAC